MTYDGCKRDVKRDATRWMYLDENGTFLRREIAIALSPVDLGAVRAA